jgi:hypothetical protein
LKARTLLRPRRLSLKGIIIPVKLENEANLD